jgi:hypothetical protein
MKPKSPVSIYKEVKALLTTSYSRMLTNPKNWVKLSTKQRRKAILLDVMKQVLLETYIPESQYVDSDLMGLNIPWEKRSKLSVQKELQEATPTCQVCQRGMMLLSCIRFNNQVTLGMYDGRCIEPLEREAGLDEYIDYDERDRMERVFESQRSSLQSNIYNYGEKLPKDIVSHRRLLAIAIAYNAYLFDSFDLNEWGY